MKYVSFWDYEFQPSATAFEVICEDREPEFTGPLDKHGNKLYRVPETVPMGFHGPKVKA